MTQLIKGMYHDGKSKFAGLAEGQIRKNNFVHNGDWYNQEGVKLGWGDLSPEDFLKISEGLNEGELFIIFFESYYLSTFVTYRSGANGSMYMVNPDAENPGVKFVSENCAYIIAKGQFYFVDRIGEVGNATLARKGLVFKVLKKDDVKAFIESFTT